MDAPDVPIWTLEARGNALLGSIATIFDMSGPQMRREIKRFHLETVEVLRRKEIDYDALRSALEPGKTRDELALVFEIDRLGEGNYGTAASRAVVPLLRKDGVHSILQGDLVASDLNAMHQFVSASINHSNNFEPGRVGFYYVIYINNLTKSDVARLTSGLESDPAYMGYASCRLASPFRTVVSHFLSASYVKAGANVVSAHEDDVPEDVDWDLGSWDWRSLGYTQRSVIEQRYGLFLSYKIERESDGPFSDDERFALNAISDRPADISNFSVEIAAEKLIYVKSEKAGSLRRLGMGDVDGESLASLIKDRLRASYFYNLRYRADFNVSLFNVLLELDDPRELGSKEKLMASLEYAEPASRLRLITLY